MVYFFFVICLQPKLQKIYFSTIFLLRFRISFINIFKFLFYQKLNLCRNPLVVSVFLLFCLLSEVNDFSFVVYFVRISHFFFLYPFTAIRVYVWTFRKSLSPKAKKWIWLFNTKKMGKKGKNFYQFNITSDRILQNLFSLFFIIIILTLPSIVLAEFFKDIIYYWISINSYDITIYSVNQNKRVSEFKPTEWKLRCICIVELV